MGNYLTRSGDTLSKIAKQSGTTVSELLKLNPDIKDANKIRINQQIKLKDNSSNDSPKEQVIVLKTKTQTKVPVKKEEKPKEEEKPVIAKKKEVKNPWLTHIYKLKGDYQRPPYSFANSPLGQLLGMTPETGFGEGRSGGGGADIHWGSPEAEQEIKEEERKIPIVISTGEVQSSAPQENKGMGGEAVVQSWGSKEYQDWYRQQPQGTIQEWKGKKYLITPGQGSNKKMKYTAEGYQIKGSEDVPKQTNGANWKRKTIDIPTGVVDSTATRFDDLMVPEIKPRLKKGGYLNMF